MRSFAELVMVGGNETEGSLSSSHRRRWSRRRLLQVSAGWLASALVADAALPALGAVNNRAETSRAAREEAARQIPLRSLTEPIRSRIHGIVSDPTLYRRLPVQVIPCDPELYIFLVRYPEVIVNMWQLMGVTRAVIRRTGAYAYDAQDGAGTVSKVELVYGTREQHLFLAEGYYDGPLVPRKVTGRCVLLLTSAFSEDQHDRKYVSNQLDVFVQLDKVGVEMVAKTLHPLLGKTVDTNFAESSRFVSQVSRVAETNGQGVQRLVGQLTQVDPQVRTRFAQITSAISQRAALRSFNVPEDGETGRLSDRNATERDTRRE